MKSELIVDLISQKILLAEINSARKKQTFDLERKPEYHNLEQKIIPELHENKKTLKQVMKKQKYSNLS